MDAKLDLLRHRLGHLPAALSVAESTRQREDRASEHGRLQTELSDLQREQRKADADVEQVKARRARNQQRIEAGLVGDPKQLQAMQHEMHSLEQRISDLEDVELEVMERVESAQAGLADLSTRIAVLDDDIVTQTVERDAATSVIASEQEAALAERDTLAVGLPDPLLALYEKLRTQLGGVAVGAIQHKRCSGCRLDIGAAELARIAAAPSDDVLRCEECNRILVRTFESGL